jgi:RNA polymerase sigma-70 factor, ECF subfamily
MNEQSRQSLFSELISRHQSELYAYIFAIVRSWEDADDLFQSVSLVLWRKFDMFREGSNFFLWARQTAQFEVRKFLTGKHLRTYVGDELLDALVETSLDTELCGVELGLAALRRCKAKLSDRDQELLDLRYAEDLGSQEIAARLQRPQHSVCHSLQRIRRWLFDCIQMEVARDEHLRGEPQ